MSEPPMTIFAGVMLVVLVLRWNLGASGGAEQALVEALDGASGEVQALIATVGGAAGEGPSVIAALDGAAGEGQALDDNAGEGQAPTAALDDVRISDAGCKT
mmetsp:Transcript_26336/g.48529  ORF Transcript_26336/g.48529 Transcript_26336/m.48529 type:complete len:102 (+) Transcript_26336:367-672(+)